MSLPKAAQSLIAIHVSKRIESYNQLSNEDKRELISTIIKNLPLFEKISFLSDIDVNSELPDIISGVISGCLYASSDLSRKIDSLVMHNAPRFFDIAGSFEDEWQEQWTSKNNEIYEEDYRRRYREAIGACSC